MTSKEAAPRTVFVFGSAHQDLVLSVDALPSSGETVMARNMTQGFGGKGANQAIAAASAGATVRFVGVIGDDEWGDRILGNLTSHAIDTSFVTRRRGESTGLAVVVVDDAGSNQIVVASGAGATFASESIAVAIDAVRAGDVVVVQCEIPAETVEHVVRLAARAGATVVLNLAPYAPLAMDALSAATTIIVNESEARALVGERVVVDALAPEIVSTVGTACIVTLGADGSVFASPAGMFSSVPAPRVDNVIDTTGAGDVYVGTFAARIALDDDVPAAMDAASLAAARSVLGRGAQARQPEHADDVIG
jgi:ribokinase